MCGVVGYVISGRTGACADSATALSMAARIAHRGPDDEGAWAEGQVALAHRRLSILDLSPAGHQPMHSVCGRYVLAFNGEIYNYRDIRKDIESDRYFAEVVKRWRGHSDTEVILAAIGRWGFVATLDRMVGMFAIALWDRQERELYLARDRMGEKPLYYGRFGDVLLFGSELKALRGHPAWHGEVDRGALSLLMRHNYIPAPYSIYKDVYKLPAASYLRVSSGGDMCVQAYWSLAKVAEAGKCSQFAGGDHEAIDALESCLSRAIRQQMVADVPLGAFLSGGIDSSTVVALMQAQSNRPVRTFSIGFFEEGFNEAQYARRVAEHLGTDHTELYVMPEQAQAIIPLLPGLYDEPFADSSQIPTFLVSQIARHHVTVSLSGDGGDELFGGYNRYFIAGDVWGKMSSIPVAMRGLVAAAIKFFHPDVWTFLGKAANHFMPMRYRFSNVGDKLHKLAGILGSGGQDAIYRQLLSHWQEPASMVIGGFEPMTSLTDPNKASNLENFVERMMLLDATSYLPDDILVKVDRAAMGVSLETRVPMLDHRLVEFAWCLPFHMKVRQGEGKWLLRQVLNRHVPMELFDRPKMGFGVPIDHWLRGPLRNWAEDLLSETRLRREGFFDPAPIRQKWTEHLHGKNNWQYLLWDVLMFQAWFEHNR